MESGFMNPIELTSTCLEPVPEGRVAEMYPMSRSYHQEISTFLRGSGKDHQVQELEEEEDDDDDDESDLDVEEIDSDSTSASEGSEDIEPFPLPPAPPPEPITSEEQQQLSPLPAPKETKRGREVHEATEEMEGAAVGETSLIECSAPSKPVTSIRLSKAIVTEHPKPMEHQQAGEKGEIMERPERAFGEEEEDIENQEAETPATTASFKKPRNRRRHAKQKQKAAIERKPSPDESVDS